MSRSNYIKHGMTGTRIHEVWKEMKRRVKGNYGNGCYKRKGIKVCDEWLQSGNFITWALSHGYKEGLQLDRIDNSGDYCPENCRFVTPKENARNRDNTIILTYKGETKPLIEWAEDLNIKHQSLYTRYHRGWSVEKMLETEIKKKEIKERII